MTVEAINSFANKAAQDAELRKEIETTAGISLQALLDMNPEQLQAANKDYPGVVTQIAAKNGFEFSREELLEQIRVATSSEELSDEQLEAVAGGKSVAGAAGDWVDQAVVDVVTDPVGTVKDAVNDTSDFFKKATKGW